MATNTYVALDKITTTGSVSSVTLSSISQAYTDLIIVTAGISSSDTSYKLQFNGDTTTNYSTTYLYGDGNTPTSGRSSNANAIVAMSRSNTVLGNGYIHIMNYSNSTTFKTILGRGGTAGAIVISAVGLWRKTPEAITSITILPESGTISAGSTFSLYGIAAASVGAKATGGTIYADDTYYYHVFGSTGTFTPLSSLTADVLVVAGGGGGGRIVAGGGGAGGLTYYASQSLTATGYTCTVGAGGAGSTTSGYSSGAQGANSQFGGLTAAVGGGAGGAINAGGGSGGSGGGAGGSNIAQSGGSATSGQGNAGGSRSADSNYEGSGGGGAGAAGSSNTTTTAGNGGVGVTTYSSWGTATGTGENISGTYYYAGGGGGGWSGAGATSANAGQGGYGGGGRGGFSNQTTTTDNAPVAGIATTGGGGGGAPNDFSGNNTNTYGANGGSGVVIVRYAK